MKKSLVAASLLLAASAVLADSNAWFVGGEFGGMSIHGKTSASASSSFSGYSFREGSSSESIDTTYEALKVGKYFEYGRVYGSFASQNKKEDISSFTYGLAYDYLFRNASAITPFLGLTASYSTSKSDDDRAKLLSIDKPKGFNYGVEAGLTYALGAHTELEIGARYLLSDVDDTFNYDDGTTNIHVKSENEHFIQYYLGLNYKF